MMASFNFEGAVISGFTGFIVFWILMSLRWRKKLSSNQLQLLVILLTFIASGIAVQSIYVGAPRLASKEIKSVLELFGFVSCMAFLAAGFFAAILSACVQILRGLKR